jgi:hypothetical protein
MLGVEKSRLLPCVSFEPVAFLESYVRSCSSKISDLRSVPVVLGDTDMNMILAFGRHHSLWCNAAARHRYCCLVVALTMPYSIFLAMCPGRRRYCRN